MKSYKNRIKYICNFCNRVICSGQHPTHELSYFNMNFVPLTERQSFLRNRDYLRDKSIAHMDICKKYKEAMPTARDDCDIVTKIYY